MHPIREQQLRAESVRRCSSHPTHAYILATLADRKGEAWFGSYGDIPAAAQQLQREGWLAVTTAGQNLTGHSVIRCLA